MNISLEHVGIPAADPQALKNWYERVLAARTIWESGENPPAYLVAFPGGGWLEIYAAKAPLPARDNNQLAGFRHLALRVDSLDAAKAELIRRGVVFTKEPGAAAGGGRVQYFADLEGNLLHFVERANDSQLK
jgi:catechol 2,3-dioxygenase-like lactoylglutathione lyase family enzyme